MDLFTRALAAWVAPANASGRVEYVSTGSGFGFGFAPTSAEAPPDVTSFSSEGGAAVGVGVPMR